MKTLKQVKVYPVFVEFIPDIYDLLPEYIYISLEYNTATHLCLCGCGNLSVTPLFSPIGWDLTVRTNDNAITLTPSILNNNCPNKSHYIITNNKANFV